MEQLSLPLIDYPGSVFNPFVWGESRVVVERFLLHVGLSGCKNAETSRQHIESFIEELSAGGSPIQRMQEIRERGGHYILLEMLKRHKIGRYTLMSRMLRDMSETPDILSMERDQLCCISGFAMKSASLFKMYSDAASRAAILDKQTLGWLKHAAPETEDGYKQVEALFVAKAKADNLHPALLCFQLWYSGKPTEVRRRCWRSMLAARRFLEKQQ